MKKLAGLFKNLASTGVNKQTRKKNNPCIVLVEIEKNLQCV